MMQSQYFNGIHRSEQSFKPINGSYSVDHDHRAHAGHHEMHSTNKMEKLKSCQLPPIPSPPYPVAVAPEARSAAEELFEASSKFRQLPCRTFISVGTCPYRERCIYLHDPRCICKDAKSKTRRKNKEDTMPESLFWPVMPYEMVATKLDGNQQPHVIQEYQVPYPQHDRYRLHDRALYSTWMHFVDSCLANANSDAQHSQQMQSCYNAPDVPVNAHTRQYRLPIFMLFSQSNGEPLNIYQIQDSKRAMTNNGIKKRSSEAAHRMGTSKSVPLEAVSPIVSDLAKMKSTSTSTSTSTSISHQIFYPIERIEAPVTSNSKITSPDRTTRSTSSPTSSTSSNSSEAHSFNTTEFDSDISKGSECEGFSDPAEVSLDIRREILDTHRTHYRDLNRTQSHTGDWQHSPLCSISTVKEFPAVANRVMNDMSHMGRDWYDATHEPHHDATISNDRFLNGLSDSGAGSGFASIIGSSSLF